MSFPHLSTECGEYHALVADGPTSHVLAEIQAERVAQDAKWGEQNHADGTGSRVQKEIAESDRLSCQRQFAEKTGTWMDILQEEVSEAFAESDPLKLRAELIQVAAVATAWAEHLNRRVAEASAWFPTCTAPGCGNGPDIVTPDGPLCVKHAAEVSA